MAGIVLAASFIVLLSPVSTRASDLESMTSHFILQSERTETPIGQRPFVSWGDTEISYVMLGDQGPWVSKAIKDYAALLARATGRKISATSPGKIVFIYDGGVFFDLRNHPDKFFKIGFPTPVVDELRRDFADKPDLRCMNQISQDGDGTIRSAFVLSKVTAADCIKRMLLASIGVQHAESDRDAAMYACLLYKGRDLGFRNAISLNEHARQLLALCSPTS